MFDVARKSINKNSAFQAEHKKMVPFLTFFNFELRTSNIEPAESSLTYMT